HALDEVLAVLDPAARRPPDPRLEVRLADQSEPLAVEDEERHVVHPLRVVGRERVLAFVDLALPVQSRWLAIALAQRRENGLGQMHLRRLPKPRAGAVARAAPPGSRRRRPPPRPAPRASAARRSAPCPRARASRLPRTAAASPASAPPRAPARARARRRRRRPRPRRAAAPLRRSGH